MSAEGSVPCALAGNVANQIRTIVRMAEEAKAERDAASCTKLHNVPCILILSH